MKINLIDIPSEIIKKKSLNSCCFTNITDIVEKLKIKIVETAQNSGIGQVFIKEITEKFESVIKISKNSLKELVTILKFYI